MRQNQSYRFTTPPLRPPTHSARNASAHLNRGVIRSRSLSPRPRLRFGDAKRSPLLLVLVEGVRGVLLGRSHGPKDSWEGVGEHVEDRAEEGEHGDRAGAEVLEEAGHGVEH